MPNNTKNLRMCCVCRMHADKSELIRIVKSKDGQIFVDKTKTADGRGVYLHSNAECMEKLKKKKLLNAAFKCVVDESVYEDLSD